MNLDAKQAKNELIKAGIFIANHGNHAYIMIIIQKCIQGIMKKNILFPKHFSEL